MRGVDVASAQVLAEEDAHARLARTYGHVQDLDVFVIDVAFIKDVPLLNLLEIAHVANVDHLFLSDYVLAELSKVGAQCSLIVVIVDRHLEVVILLTGEDAEVGLARLVGDAVSYFGANDHLRALHEVCHHVLKFRNQLFEVSENEEVNLLLCGDLESNIATDKEDLTTHVVDLMDLLPLVDPNGSFTIRVFHLHGLLLEDQDTVGGTHNERPLECKIHVTEVDLGHLLAILDNNAVWKAAIFGLVDWSLRRDALTLSVESVLLVVRIVVETAQREVYFG